MFYWLLSVTKDSVRGGWRDGCTTLKCRLSEIDSVFISLRFSKFTQSTQWLGQPAQINTFCTPSPLVSLICIFRIAFIMIKGKHVGWLVWSVICSVGRFVGSVGWLVGRLAGFRLVKLNLVAVVVYPQCHVVVAHAVVWKRVFCTSTCTCTTPPHTHKSLQLKSKYDQAISTHQPSSQLE